MNKEYVSTTTSGSVSCPVTTASFGNTANSPLAETCTAKWDEIAEMVKGVRPMFLPPPYKRPVA